jgi:hypothetical protein
VLKQQRIFFVAAPGDLADDNADVATNLAAVDLKRFAPSTV